MGSDEQQKMVTTGRKLSVRVPLNSYVTAFMVGSFFAGLFVYLEFDRFAYSMFVLSWVVVPLFAFSDRLVFDGKRIRRTGILPRIWAAITGGRSRLRIRDIEQIDSATLRIIRRGGNAHYRFRTAIRGRDELFVITSGGSDHRELLTAILSSVPNEVLDQRSIDLRDYLADPKEVAMKASFSRIPEADVLESTLFSRPVSRKAIQIGTDEESDSEELRMLGNELRVAGRIHQSLEVFRRAFHRERANAHLYFDLARCLFVMAGIRRDSKLHRRSVAALRLAERHSQNDGNLLARLGETYFQLGDIKRATTAFLNAIEKGSGYLGSRGLAEIALREGKLAHVVHQFSSAHENAESRAAKRFSQSEADYFSNLTSDSEYMDLEVHRVNLVNSLSTAGRTALTVTLFGLIPLIFGLVADDSLLADIGWAVSGLALIIWCVLKVVCRMLASRIPYDIAATDN
ncbi:MAG TPA: hypothetical protein PKA82_03520 [Pyrinomonadaceae bacterium]|nr:hypothetical protein [Pyrinomonadaceae bacterium]